MKLLFELGKRGSIRDVKDIYGTIVGYGNMMDEMVKSVYLIHLDKGVETEAGWIGVMVVHPDNFIPEEWGDSNKTMRDK